MNHLHWIGRAYCLLHGYDKQCMANSRNKVVSSLRRLRIEENCNHRSKKILTWRVGGVLNGDAPVQCESVVSKIDIRCFRDQTK